jgi:hypothetical protein
MSYLSFVFTGSNACYGGDFIQRMQNCLDNLYGLLEQHGFDADVTVVEWNPPKDRPRIADALDWNSKWIQTKIITVPGEVHNSLPNPHGEKFFEYVAKNVGIRRASGEFILSTNPDNIYSPELIQRLSKLDKDCFYRVNRYDVRDGKVTAANFNTGTRYPDGSSTESELTNPDPDGLHFNASGDFILMHRDAWAAIKGHPEVPYSLTVDGQTVYLAAQEGLKQVILPEPMFHQDHSRTDKWCPPWDDNSPWGEKNAIDWGLSELSFETRYL